MSDPVSDLKRELIAAAERQQRHAAAHARRRRLGRYLGRNRLLLAAATLVIAATASLLASTPWDTSPSFLARAEAALRPPGGVVLHQKWVATTTSAEFACTVRHRPSEIWIDQTPPHRYRVLLSDPPPPKLLNAGRRALACWNGKGPELGGVLDSDETLEFVSPDELRSVDPRFGAPVDPVGDLRQSLGAGTAHDEGKTKLDGRTVQRIRVDPDPRCASRGCPRQPLYWYVDPKTFHPVEMEGPAGIDRPGRRFLRLHVVVRFLAYEYLPRTAANLALADIREQHPNAILAQTNHSRP
jgi:hypothetical protein